MPEQAWVFPGAGGGHPWVQCRGGGAGSSLPSASLPAGSDELLLLLPTGLQLWAIFSSGFEQKQEVTQPNPHSRLLTQEGVSGGLHSSLFRRNNFSFSCLTLSSESAFPCLLWNNYFSNIGALCSEIPDIPDTFCDVTFDSQLGESLNIQHGKMFIEGPLFGLQGSEVSGRPRTFFTFFYETAKVKGFHTQYPTEPNAPGTEQTILQGLKG